MFRYGGILAVDGQELGWNYQNNIEFIHSGINFIWKSSIMLNLYTPRHYHLGTFTARYPAQAFIINLIQHRPLFN